MSCFSNSRLLLNNAPLFEGEDWECPDCGEWWGEGIYRCLGCEEESWIRWEGCDKEVWEEAQGIGDLPLEGQTSRETEGICPSRAERRDHQSGCSRHKRCSGHRPHYWYTEVVNRRGEICSRADAALEEKLMKMTGMADGFGLAEKGQTAPVVCWDRQIKAKRVKQARYQARKAKAATGQSIKEEMKLQASDGELDYMERREAIEVIEVRSSMETQKVLRDYPEMAKSLWDLGTVSCW